jgi:hypothetical protein
VNPSLKYSLGRVGLFVVVLAVLYPVPLDLLVKLMIAVATSAVLSFFLLRRWRDEMAGQLATVATKRKAQKEKLRAALAGDDELPPA